MNEFRALGSVKKMKYGSIDYRCGFVFCVCVCMHVCLSVCVDICACVYLCAACMCVGGHSLWGGVPVCMCPHTYSCMNLGAQVSWHIDGGQRTTSDTGPWLVGSQKMLKEDLRLK